MAKQSKVSRNKRTKNKTSKKNRIFSGRGYNPRGSVKRAEKKGIITRILDNEDISDLNKEDIADLRAYLKNQQKVIQDLVAKDSDNYYSSKVAEEIGILEDERYKSKDPVELFDLLMRQQEYYAEREADEDMFRMGEEDEEMKALMQDSDKWNILRRLASVDPMINMDKSYASEVLRIIEAMIEQYKYQMTYMELADMMINNYYANEHYENSVYKNRAVDSMRPFNTRSTSFDNYAASWNNPFGF